jgi:hypothetical protein
MRWSGADLVKKSKNHSKKERTEKKRGKLMMI